MKYPTGRPVHTDHRKKSIYIASYFLSGVCNERPLVGDGKRMKSFILYEWEGFDGHFYTRFSDGAIGHVRCFCFENDAD